MNENEAIKMFNDLLDVPCEMLIKYDSVINSEKKQALVKKDLKNMGKKKNDNKRSKYKKRWI